MWAWVLPSGEGELVMREVELPPLRPGWARVRLSAAALNHRDLWITKKLYPKIQYPTILGSDGAGVVVEAPSAPHWEGKKVVLNPSLEWGPNPRVQSEAYHILGMPTWGTLAQFVDVPVENLYEIPDYLHEWEAAALPLAGLTAYRAVFTQGKLTSGQKVLITGIGGGVATWAFLLCRTQTETIYVTSSSPHKLEAAIAQGAKDGVLYTHKEELLKLQKAVPTGFDLIVDGAGGELFPVLVNLLGPAGTLVVYGATAGNPPSIDLRRLFWRQSRIQGSTMGNSHDFEGFLSLVKAHQLRPIVDRVFAFSEVPAAFAHMEKAQQLGKIVIQIA
ncbi:MAG: zinc-binding dehydrogenase [Bacteroidia bacterium]